MKILAVSDMVVDTIYSARVAESIPKVDLVIGCGDLPFDYLEFLNAALNVPLVYVPGNHDPAHSERDPACQAEGCEWIDRQFVHVRGLNIAGIGGSIRYKQGAPNQYNQAEMRTRLALFTPRLRRQLRRHGGVLDILITHSPPFGVHDGDDPAHVGFHAFREFIQEIQPRYCLHGHTANNKVNLVEETSLLGTTRIININPYRLLEIQPHV